MRYFRQILLDDFKLTFIFDIIVQQANLNKMLRCGDRQRQGITNSFMESWVGALAKDVRLVPVEQEVVNVTHLVVCRDKPVFCDFRALSNPENKIL